MGQIVQVDSAESVALIKEASGAVKAVKRDMVILDRFKVLGVYAGHIDVITRDAKRYHIFQGKFEGAPGAPNLARVSAAGDTFHEDGFERSSGKIVMSGSYRDKLVKEDLAKVMMQMTAEPYFENGAIVGFKLSQIDEGSIFQKSGLKDGDIIAAINGLEMNSIAGAISTLKGLKGVDHIDVDIRRGAGTQKVSVDVR
jgi:type II secretion system protein C